MSKARKLARIQRAPEHDIPYSVRKAKKTKLDPLFVAPMKLDVSKLRSADPALDELLRGDFVTIVREAWRIVRRQWLSNPGKVPIGAWADPGDWDMSHRPAPEAPDPEAWSRRVSAAGDIIEEHRVATGRDLGGYEEIFAAPAIEVREVKGAPSITVNIPDGTYTLDSWGKMMIEAFEQLGKEIEESFLMGDGIGRPSGILLTGQPDPKHNGVYAGGRGKWIAIDETEKQKPIKKGPIWPAYD